MPVDEADLKILEMLRRNSRVPYSEIARAIGMSEAAVRKRISALARRGVIRRFTIDYELEEEVRALVLVKTGPPARTPEVAQRIRGVEGVELVYEVTGEHDIAVLVRGRGTGFINRCIDSIRSVPGVAATYTMIVLRSH